MEFGAEGWGSGIRVWSFEYDDCGVGFREEGLGLRVLDRWRVQLFHSILGLGFRV